MFGLALRTVRHRPGRFVATFLTTLLGACIVMTFASLLDTALQSGVDESSRTTLLMTSGVVGGWGFALVAIAVVSTLTLLVRQRKAELTMLKNIGATPVQLRRMIITEAALVAMVSVILAIAPATFLSGLLINRLHDTHQINDLTNRQFGWITLLVGVTITAGAAITAAALAARSVTTFVVRPHLSATRLTMGWTLLAAGTTCAVVTAVALKNLKPVMAVAGMASILCALGFGLLAPALLRFAVVLVSGPLNRLGVGGYLAVRNAAHGTQREAGALLPIILFTGIGNGTLYMQSINDPALSDPHQSALLRNIQQLNIIVVGMITLFTAIMVINTLIAATVHRRHEFGQQRLIGCTLGQVTSMVGTESAVLSVIGVLFGSLASLAAIVPYSLIKTGSALPSGSPALYLCIIATAVVLSLAASVGTTRQVMRTPAVDEVTAA
jgi:putative ABC transport system permease protein